jgi:NADH dehydrogenase (ubiquinone) 1 alpha subcomplex subunit 6
MRKFPLIASKNFDEARKNALRLYRNCLRAIPYVIRHYKLEFRPHQIKNTLRQEFLRNKNITDPSLIDILVFKGQMELEETLNLWKTRGHVVKLLAPRNELEEVPELRQFLQQTSIPLSSEFYRRRPPSSSPPASSSPNLSNTTAHPNTSPSSNTSSSFTSSKLLNK